MPEADRKDVKLSKMEKLIVDRAHAMVLIHDPRTATSKSSGNLIGGLFALQSDVPEAENLVTVSASFCNVVDLPRFSKLGLRNRLIGRALATSMEHKVWAVASNSRLFLEKTKDLLRQRFGVVYSTYFGKKFGKHYLEKKIESLFHAYNYDKDKRLNLIVSDSDLAYEALFNEEPF